MTDEEQTEAQKARTRTIQRAENILNDIEDNASDDGAASADLISFLGYVAGMAETTFSVLGDNETARGLFGASRLMGRNHALMRQEIIPTPKDNV